MAIKAKEIVKRYNFNQDDFDSILFRNLDKLPGVKSTFTGLTIDEACVDQVVDFYIKEKEEQNAAIQKRQKAKADREEATANMLLTTGYDFQGYKITKYIDVYFDEIVFGMGFAKGIAASFENIGAAFSGGEATVVTERLNEIKGILKDRIKAKALDNGANALLGIDFESSSVGDLMMVSMTATAVVIEPVTNNSEE